MSLLCWDKPEQKRPTTEHNDKFQSDSGVDGTFVPNMSEEDMDKWKAKKVGGTDPRVEIRKTTRGPARGSDKYGSYAQALLTVRWDTSKGRASATFSSNGKAEFDLVDLRDVLIEAEKHVF